MLEVANGEYGDYTDLMAKAATEPQWRLVPTIPKSRKLHLNLWVYELFFYFTVEDTKKYLTHQNSFSNHDNKTEVLVQPPTEWFKLCILINRTLLQLYRDWVRYLLDIYFYCLDYLICDNAEKFHFPV